MDNYSYSEAFSRNIGIISEPNQKRLQDSTVAIAGMGGVGGDYLVTLMRSGIGNYKISDFDDFELANFNRQYGATIDTIGKPKLDVMAELASRINPEANIERFESGINQENLDAFLDNVDVLVDGVEFFEVEVHRMLIMGAVERGIPVLAAVPLGFGVGMLSFTAKGMSFDDYFDIDLSLPLENQVLLFSLGFAPAGFHIKYVDPASVDLKNRKGPSFIGACKLCAGMVAAQAVQAILEPETLKPIPWYSHFDAKLNKFKHGKLLMGNRNPLQRLKYAYAKKILGI
ncbi:MAG: ThiF family adenylyltransferase [Sedimenticola sp.]